MTSPMLLGQYINTVSPVHVTDARSKFLASLLLSIAVFQVDKWWELALITLIFVGILRLAVLSGNLLFQALRPLVPFLVVAFFIHLLTTPGDVFWQLGLLQITTQGLEQAVLVSWRIALLTGLAFVLMATTTALDMVAAIEWLLGPLRKLRVPVGQLALMMGIALRFIPIIFTEANKLKRAQVSRGGALDHGKWSERMLTIYAMMVPLLVLIFKRADQLATAMEARCYTGDMTLQTQNKLGFRDFWILTLAGLISLLFI